MRKPSVTELVGMLDKPALLRWANRQGLQGIDIERERRRTKALGTSIHDQIRAREFVDPHHAGNFERFMRDKEIICLERDIETEWFVGRYDALLLWSGQRCLVDWKRSRGLYFDNELQLVAYGMAEPADRFAVVNTPDFILTEARIKDRSKYEDILIALAQIWTLRREIEGEPKWK